MLEADAAPSPAELAALSADASAAKKQAEEARASLRKLVTDTIVAAAGVDFSGVAGKLVGALESALAAELVRRADKALVERLSRAPAARTVEAVDLFSLSALAQGAGLARRWAAETIPFTDAASAREAIDRAAARAAELEGRRAEVRKEMHRTAEEIRGKATPPRGR
jgi:hypothetical protein